MQIPVNAMPDTIYSLVPDAAKCNQQEFYIVLRAPNAVREMFGNFNAASGVTWNDYKQVIMMAIDEVLEAPARAVAGDIVLDYNTFANAGNWAPGIERLITATFTTLGKLFYHVFGVNGLIYADPAGHSRCDFFLQGLFEGKHDLQVLLAYTAY